MVHGPVERYLGDLERSWALSRCRAMHNLGMWRLGQGTEYRSVGGFFLLLGVGFKEATGHPSYVGRLWPWVRTNEGCG